VHARQRRDETPVPINAGVAASADKGTLAGVMISGLAGLGWTQWGASGFSGAASTTVRSAGIVVALVILAWSARLWHSAPSPTSPAGAPSKERSGSMFSSRAYLVVVVVQAIVCGVGNQLLVRTGHPGYTVAWIATVVGTHFVVLGRLFFPGFYWLGAALIAAGLAGVVVGLAGGGPGSIKATAGLIAATSLFVAGGSTLARARTGSHP